MLGVIYLIAEMASFRKREAAPPPSHSVHTPGEGGLDASHGQALRLVGSDHAKAADTRREDHQIYLCPSNKVERSSSDNCCSSKTNTSTDSGLERCSTHTDIESKHTNTHHEGAGIYADLTIEVLNEPSVHSSDTQGLISEAGNERGDTPSNPKQHINRRASITNSQEDQHSTNAQACVGGPGGDQTCRGITPNACRADSGALTIEGLSLDGDPGAQAPPSLSQAWASEALSEAQTQSLRLLQSLGAGGEVRPYRELGQREGMPGAFCKNLLLRDRRGAYYLLVFAEARRADLRRLRGPLGAYRSLSFAGPTEVADLLGCVPGGVSPLGVLHDTNSKVKVVLDEDLIQEELLNFHPLDPSTTTLVPPQILLAYMRHFQHDPLVIPLPAEG